MSITLIHYNIDVKISYIFIYFSNIINIEQPKQI